MSGVYNGQRFDVPGVSIVSWIDDPRALRVERNLTPRTQRVSMIMFHVTGGTPTVVTRGAGPASTDPFYWSRDAATNDRRVSWDATVRRDGTVLWHNDPATHYTWHGNEANPRAIGIEIETTEAGKVYQVQIEAAAKVGLALARLAGIQWQTPWKNGSPDRSVLTRLVSGGADVTGFVGHRNVNANKSDPGDAIFLALAQKGAEKFDFGTGADKQEWAARQRGMGVTPDGVPGPVTVTSLRSQGYSDGIWAAGKGPSLLTWATLVVVGSAIAYGVWSTNWRARGA